MLQPIEQFRGAILAAGLTPPDEVVADGKLRRFSSKGKRGDDSGWYVLNGDGVPAGAFGCWREGFTQQWSVKPQEAMTQGARGFYLTGYDGNQGHAVDRIGRGESYVPRVCLAMLGSIQPGKLQSYVREAVVGGAGDDGLLQRFGLAVWPDVDREYVHVDRWPDTPARQRAWEVFERLNALQPATETDPREWRFSPQAQELFEQWLIPFETEIRGVELHPALVSHLSKYSKLIPALALIFAMVDTPASGGVIHERELLRALAWCDYLRTHSERMYAAAVIPETAGAEALLSKIKAGKLCDGDGVLMQSFEPWKVAVKGWAGLNSPEAVKKAAGVLADYGWLARETVPTGTKGGRPSERYLIHPMLMKGGA